MISSIDAKQKKSASHQRKLGLITLNAKRSRPIPVTTAGVPTFVSGCHNQPTWQPETEIFCTQKIGVTGRSVFLIIFLLFLFTTVSIVADDKESQESLVRNPLVDSGTELIELDPKEPIWVNTERNAVVLIGSICLREGLLELFACRTNSKEHESIIAIDVRPHLIHAALLVIGATQGSPARFDPVFEPPKGELIDIEVRWEVNGKIQKMKSQEMIREVQSQKEMSCQWVFTGGLFTTDSKGKRFYLADISGELFGVSNFPGSILDVPFESSAENDLLYYEPNTEKIPPLGTTVTLILKKLPILKNR